MASISIRALSKRYDQGAWALRDVSLEIADGELLALLGPSGCGKSTILRTIAGLEEPSGGSVSIGERDVTALPPAERNIAMVFQSYALYPHLTVRGNLEFPLRMHRVPPAERSARITRVAAQLGLGELLQRLPGQLSGGQRQRVALGRALVREPDAFLLDEPLSNLDAALRAQLRAELLALHASLGATMVYVTHDQVEALTLGQRLVVLREGRVEQVGTPDEVYRRPASTFVARFVGTPGMNLTAVDGPAAALADGAVPPGAATIGVRPEDLRLLPHGEPAAEVVLVERLGSETLVHLRAGAETLVARVPGFDPVQAGARVALAADRARLHWFDREDRRLA